MKILNEYDGDGIGVSLTDAELEFLQHHGEKITEILKTHPVDQIVIIGSELYGEMFDAFITLNALENAGVDNWEGWDYAMQILEEMKEEQG